MFLKKGEAPDPENGFIGKKMTAHEVCIVVRAVKCLFSESLMERRKMKKLHSNVK